MIDVQNCLILDTETNGKSESPTVLEIGAVLYSVTSASMLSCGSSLIEVDKDLVNDAFLINRISPELTRQCISTQSFFLDWLQSVYAQADVIVAHNAAYDSSIIKSLNWAKDWDKPWLCTLKDFELFPDSYKGKRDLLSLAQFYYVGISCSHRAIDDVLLLKEVFNRVPDLPFHFYLAQLPFIEAIVPFNDSTAKERGFNWDRNIQGWIKKDKSETFDFPVFPLSDTRINVKAIVSYEDRNLAKDWGFVWNTEKRYWSRLGNPFALKFFPFSVAELLKDDAV